MIDLRPRRPFTALDAILLAAFVALGLAAARGPAGAPRESFASPPDFIKTSLIELLSGPVPAFLTVATLGAALVIFRRPRPGGRRGQSGPGIQAMAAAGAVGGLLVANEFLSRRFPNLLPRFQPSPLPTVWWQIAPRIAMTVLVVWVVLAIGRAWRPQAEWRDRLGRVLGWAWIAHWTWSQLAWPALGRFGTG